MKIQWKEIEKCKPPEDTLLMVTGPSGYITHKKFLCIAYYDETYRPSFNDRIRWQSVSNDSLSDCGWHPTHWSYLMELPA
jgi:hypothetical protein